MFNTCSCRCCLQIALGRNDYIAWGDTTTGADLQDVFIIDSINRTHYAVGEHVLAYNITTKHIPVKVSCRLQVQSVRKP